MKVTYNSYPLFGAATVERLEPEHVTLDVAGQCLGMIAAAYTVQFEDSWLYKSPLPRGSVARHFQPSNPEKIAANQHHILRTIGEGSEYWVFRSPANQICALTKVTPEFSDVAIHLGQSSPDELYLNDAITHPRSRNRHLASMTLLAALRFSRAGDDSRVTLDGYKESTVNGWITRLGFEPTGPVNEDDPFVIGGIPLPQSHFTTPSGVYKSDLVRRMEERREWLQDATITEC